MPFSLNSISRLVAYPHHQAVQSLGSTAVQPSAKFADDVEIGAYAIIEDDVVLGAGSVIRPHAVVRRYTRLGCGNFVDSHAVLGGDPQDLKYDPITVCYLEIGDKNIFREGATVSRATGNGQKTIVGNHTFWMANSHVGHHAIIHDNGVLVSVPWSPAIAQSTRAPSYRLNGRFISFAGWAKMPCSRVGPLRACMFRRSRSVQDRIMWFQ
jgi:NDP-sugar pyrophosphorylase family protein